MIHLFEGKIKLLGSIPEAGFTGARPEGTMLVAILTLFQEVSSTFGWILRRNVFFTRSGVERGTVRGTELE